MAHTRPDGACRVWTLGRDSDGYGRKTVLGKRCRAHRLSYELHFGPIPNGLIVRHACDNPACINPTHLLLGTHADNMRDKRDRDRASKGESHVNAKLNDDVVDMIRSLYVSRHPEYGGAALGRRFGVTGQQVGRIAGGRQRGGVPCAH
ncbi:HNH endonuclease signature motif containing protein [Caballeronia sp. LjRoot31]|uniref:HNH endonuclease signature motif containing protein n=1 Tax=Caballeronia sp. LjRoot31 TaxID=3342324 RepID=UPI003ECFFB36